MIPGNWQVAADSGSSDSFGNLIAWRRASARITVHPLITQVTVQTIMIPSKEERKSVYLANPYGFSAQQQALLLPQFVDALAALGLDVWEPFARPGEKVDRTEQGWAYRIGQLCYRDVCEADAIFAVVNGVPPDEGVMIELGMAIALGKPTFLFRDDFRSVADTDEYPLNLMLFTGMPQDEWERYYYRSVEEITAPDKALARWAAG